MNREQAASILDAYVLESCGRNEKCAGALREVILDAMTSVRYYPVYTSGLKYGWHTEPAINLTSGATVTDDKAVLL